MEVLLVEDNPGDVRLTQEAFRFASQSIHLHVAVDGADAIAFLQKVGGHAHAPCPDIILLDLNLPKVDGLEVLALIKNDQTLKNHSHDNFYDFLSGKGYCEVLSSPGKLLPQQASPVGRVRIPRKEHQRVLVHKGCAAETDEVRTDIVVGAKLRGGGLMVSGQKCCRCWTLPNVGDAFRGMVWQRHGLTESTVFF